MNVHINLRNIFFAYHCYSWTEKSETSSNVFHMNKSQGTIQIKSQDYTSIILYSTYSILCIYKIFNFEISSSTYCIKQIIFMVYFSEISQFVTITIQYFGYKIRVFFLYKNLFFFARLNRFLYILVLKCPISACRFLNH